MVGAYTKLAAKVIEKSVTDVNRQQAMGGVGGGFQDQVSPFQQMLNSVEGGEQFAANIGVGNQNIGLPSHHVNSISADGIPIDTANYNVGLNQPDGINKVVDLLSEVNNGQMQMEGMVNQILYSGKKFNNQELLAIQAHVFHFAQVTELVVKAADQGVSSVKSVLNTNIQ